MEDEFELFLEIDDPQPGETVASEFYTFRGRTTPGATVRAGRFDATVDDDGAWSLLLRLSSGANLVTFVATDDTDDEVVAQVAVFFEVDDPGQDPGSP